MLKALLLISLLLPFAAKSEDVKQYLYRMTIQGHKAVSYQQAKRHLFGSLHLEQDSQGYYVKDHYCEKSYRSGMGPGAMPNQDELNCEHTWPQSKFTSRFPEKVQQADLHHLFPTDSRANSTRGNHPFAEVRGNKNLRNCESSQSGASETKGGDFYFEPPTDHKGNVARAMFYFSIRYKMEIDLAQEEYLRKWHELDPVDEAEMNRNNEIQKIQGNRNPFIDKPDLVRQVSNF